jgi:hypothetical protein
MTSADAHRRTQEVVSDRAGRSRESASRSSHAIAPRHDVDEQERFISQLGVMLIEPHAAATTSAPRISGTAAAGR